MPNQTPFSELLEVAHMLADAARIETMRSFRSLSLTASNKDRAGGFDPVTVADKNSEQKMRELLAVHRPQDGILGEEFGTQSGDSGYTWVLDPIDGTRAYICGTASWGVLISVERDGHPVLGMIDQPYLEERFIGCSAQAALNSRNGETPLKTRYCESLGEAVLLTTFPEVGTTQERQRFEKVRDQVKLTRYGLDCYGYALLALGQVDLVIEAGLSRYDISAPIAVVEAAGGIVTNWLGGPVDESGQVIAAGNPKIHADALRILNA